MADKEINLDAITVEDAGMLYWEGKRLVINDGHIVEIVKETK